MGEAGFYGACLYKGLSYVLCFLIFGPFKMGAEAAAAVDVAPSYIQLTWDLRILFGRCIRLLSVVGHHHGKLKVLGGSLLSRRVFVVV